VPARRITLAIVFGLALATCGRAAAQDRAVFASPGAGSAVGLFSDLENMRRYARGLSAVRQK
jgi:hypothetical protein